MSHHEHGHDHDHDHDHEHDHEHDHGLDEQERERRAAHIVLDGVSVGFETDGTDPIELAFNQLLEIDAIELLLDEEEDELELDISPLMAGVLHLVRTLVEDLAARDGSTPADVIAATRARLDG